MTQKRSLMLKRYLFFLLVCCANIQLYGNPPVDENAGGGKAYREQYKQGNLYIWNNRAKNPQKAVAAARILLKLSDSVNDERGKSETLNYLAVAMFYLHDLQPAYDTLLLAVQIAQRYNDSTELGFAFNNLGAVYSRKNQYADATAHILEAIRIFEAIRDTNSATFSLISLGIMHSLETEHEKAMSCYTQVKNYREREGDLEKLARIYSCIADEYFQQQEIDSAMYYFKKVEALYPKIDSTFHDAILLGAKANYHLQKSEFSLANVAANTALEKARSFENREEEIKILRIIAAIALAQKNSKIAISEATLALQIGLKIGSQPQELECYELLGRIYETTGNYHLAMIFKNKALILEKQIFKTVRLRDIAALTVQHEARKKEMENALLRKNSELQNRKLEIRTYIAIILLITLVLGGIAIAAQFRMLRNKTKLNLEISKQKEELESLNQRLIEANNTKDKFFSIIAHDLKNPFNTLLNISQLMIEDFDTLSEQEKKVFLHSFHEASQNTYQLLSNLLEWSSSQTGKIQVRKAFYQVSELAGSSLPLLTQMASKKDISISTNIPAELQIQTDGDLLITVLRNLLTNAIKFSNPKGSIIITAVQIHNTVEIMIEDNGVGMDQNTLNSLFRLDIRNKRDGTANEKGTGIGLLLCHEFVTLLGGTITVLSKEGKGTKFTISLPA